MGQEEEVRRYLFRVCVAEQETWEVEAKSLSEAVALVAAGKIQLRTIATAALVPEVGTRGVLSVEELTGEGAWREVPKTELEEAARDTLQAPADTLEAVVKRLTGGDEA